MRSVVVTTRGRAMRFMISRARVTLREALAEEGRHAKPGTQITVFTIERTSSERRGDHTGRSRGGVARVRERVYELLGEPAETWMLRSLRTGPLRAGEPAPAGDMFDALDSLVQASPGRIASFKWREREKRNRWRAMKRSPIIGPAQLVLLRAHDVRPAGQPPVEELP